MALLALLIPMGAAVHGMSTPAASATRNAQEQATLEDTGLGNVNALPAKAPVNEEDGLPLPELGPATSTEPIQPELAPATSITQGASIPAVSLSGTGGGNGVDLGLVITICVAEIGLTAGLLRLLKR